MDPSIRQLGCAVVWWCSIDHRPTHASREKYRADLNLTRRLDCYLSLPPRLRNVPAETSVSCHVQPCIVWVSGDQLVMFVLSTGAIERLWKISAQLHAQRNIMTISIYACTLYVYMPAEITPETAYFK